MKIKFNNWLKEAKPKITRPEKYSGTITTISNHFKKYLNNNIDLYEITDVHELLRLTAEYFSYNNFFEKNQTGNRMYSRALDLYTEFLETNKNQIDNSIKQVEQIINDSKLTPFQRESIILSRIGQGKYRDELIDIWKCCAISKFNDTRFLIASHIKPWAKSDYHEKIDKHNGLLLLPTYDKLFDLGFISFDDNGKIIISRHLNDYEKLGICENITIDIKNGNLEYLKYHRENILKKITINNDLFISGDHITWSPFSCYNYLIYSNNYHR